MNECYSDWPVLWAGVKSGQYTGARWCRLPLPLCSQFHLSPVPSPRCCLVVGKEDFGLVHSVTSAASHMNDSYPCHPPIQSTQPHSTHRITHSRIQPSHIHLYSHLIPPFSAHPPPLSRGKSTHHHVPPLSNPSRPKPNPVKPNPPHIHPGQFPRQQCIVMRHWPLHPVLV